MVKSARKRPAQGMKPVLRMLKLARAPAVLGMMVGMLFMQSPEGTFTTPRFYMSESFAGQAAVTKAFRADGKPGMAMDKKYGDEFDILTHLKVILQTEVAAILAPVCSSFSRVNAGTAMRCTTRPLGNTQYDSVRNGNALVTRMGGTFCSCQIISEHFVILLILEHLWSWNSGGLEAVSDPGAVVIPEALELIPEHMCIINIWNVCSQWHSGSPGSFGNMPTAHSGNFGNPQSSSLRNSKSMETCMLF